MRTNTRQVMQSVDKSDEKVGLGLSSRVPISILTCPGLVCLSDKLAMCMWVFTRRTAHWRAAFTKTPHIAHRANSIMQAPMAIMMTTPCSSVDFDFMTVLVTAPPSRGKRENTPNEGKWPVCKDKPSAINVNPANWNNRTHSLAIPQRRKCNAVCTVSYS